MGTKGTLAVTDPADGKPGWRLYEELFENGVVYLEFKGVKIEELRTSTGEGADLVVRLPIETAKQLGLHTVVPPELWEAAADPEKWA
ncbi:hypothetical protein IAG25_32665 [Caballeronia sp. EK]|uniref:hypothetical protein n=1 Tax=Caballeronia sp. EK TaxID=2767469 RepID=UPI001655B41E|nr:hypothetical protein [Caballeronia sp. EK]MBC8641578.1 hypothetical protein [Caballeronia sp. EK]